MGGKLKFAIDRVRSLDVVLPDANYCSADGVFNVSQWNFFHPFRAHTQ